MPWIGGGAPEATLYDVRTAADTAFALVWGMSRSRLGDRGPCVAGFEEHLVWLAVDPRLRVARSQRVLVASCLEDRESSPANMEQAALRGDTLAVKVYDARAERTLVVRYDGRTPGLGMRVDTIGTRDP